ncbi:fatty acyl-CoA reductase wat-like [Prorops nasuta]|uniref:fatty acyl-CoA reductase wat-like n=1 Tax=Prorops nasuta TaxID=863751 RepID=UPI0034CF5758
MTVTDEHKSDTYLKEMLDMTEDSPLEDLTESSEITKFFTDQNVLVTGGSGFMGKLLIEKLLRCCPNIGVLYMFLRPKKGKSTEERFKEHFEDAIYDRLKKERPRFAEKIIMIEADTGAEDLDLSAEHRKLLLNTTVIFHGAATVRFDESVRLATSINVRGTKLLLLFAREMPNLKVFVHISTAFSHCIYKYIEEKFYPPPIETDKLLTLLDILDDDKLAKMQSTLIDKFPNTYAYTKAVAEDTVRQYSTGIPTCIVRPSIVIATAKEPIRGWINNLYGPTGVVVGAGIGLLRTLHCDSNKIADIIPADYVTSNIVVAAWDTATNHKIPASVRNFSGETKEEEKGSIEQVNTQEIPIYNSVSCNQKPITWGQFMKFNEVYGWEVPSESVLWYYMFMLNKNRYVHMICVILLHFLPAAIVDTLAFLTGRKPMLWTAYRKIHKFSDVISYFSTQQWRFNNDNVLKLWERIGPTDRILYNFNLTNLDWSEYFYFHVRGLRIFLIKDPLTTVKKGRTKFQRLEVAHKTLLTIFFLLLLWAFVSFLRFLWSVFSSYLEL